jgi:hypothetical protein
MSCPCLDPFPLPGYLSRADFEDHDVGCCPRPTAGPCHLWLPPGSHPQSHGRAGRPSAAPHPSFGTRSQAEKPRPMCCRRHSTLANVFRLNRAFPARRQARVASSRWPCATRQAADQAADTDHPCQTAGQMPSAAPVASGPLQLPRRRRRATAACAVYFSRQSRRARQCPASPTILRQCCDSCPLWIIGTLRVLCWYRWRACWCSKESPTRKG